MLARRSLASTLALAACGAGLLGPRGASARTAPEFVGIDGWLNTARPLTLAGLRGRPVLVQFCTYTCINWRRTLPYGNRWASDYGPLGLQVIGVHTPEFSFERVRPNVEAVLPTLGVTYPIALDNEYRTWRAWSNSAWPSFYLLDGTGQIRLVREGEGHAEEIEAAIRVLLGLPRRLGSASEEADLSGIGTPEMYFGAVHPTPQDPAQSPRAGEADYVLADPRGPRLNEYDLEGRWARVGEALVLRSAAGRARIRFSAAKLHLVAGSPSGLPVRVRVANSPERTVEIGLPTLYTLLQGERYGEHLLELEAAGPGLALYSATFG